MIMQFVMVSNTTNYSHRDSTACGLVLGSASYVSSKLCMLNSKPSGGFCQSIKQKSEIVHPLRSTPLITFGCVQKSRSLFEARQQVSMNSCTRTNLRKSPLCLMISILNSDSRMLPTASQSGCLATLLDANIGA